MNENELLIRIKKATLYFYTEFREDTGDNQTALRLTSEAMATYRTMLINEEKEKSNKDKLTEKQYKLLSEALGNLEEGNIIMGWLHKLNKNDITELTKGEAMEIISDVIKKRHGD